LQLELFEINLNLLIMLNHYETVFITTPVLSEAQIKEAVEKFKAVITDNGGNIEHEEDWGLRKLAYPIQKKTTGFYHLIQFNAPGELVDMLELQYRRDEKVLRFLSFRLDKHAYEYAAKRRNNKKEVKEDK
jgi:small subunit ribosomal protein S6